MAIRTNADLLRTVELHVESLDAGLEPADWQRLLDATDFTLLVLRAPALLSRAEAAFLSAWLRDADAAQRIAIAVNQVDLVPAEERAGLVERVREYLGELGGGVPVLQLSALSAARSGDREPEDGFEQLRQLVVEDLVAEHAALKLGAVHEAIASCLGALADAIARRRDRTRRGEDALRAQLAELDRSSAVLRSRIERTQSQIEVFIRTLAREELLAEVDAFSRKLMQALPDELRAVDDLAAARSSLPGYVETVWGEFFECALPRVQDQIVKELARVAEQAAADLRDCLGDDLGSLDALAGDFDPTPKAMQAFWMPRRAGGSAANVATTLQFTGLLMLAFPGLGMLGLASLGLGQIIRAAGGRGERAGERQALLDALLGAWPEIERQVRVQTQQHFDALASELQRAVAELYERAIERMRESLAQVAADGEATSERAAELATLADETIPALRRRLSALAG